MKVAIAAIRTGDAKISRHELITSLQETGYDVVYIGQGSEENLHPDYKKYNIKFQSIPLKRNNTNPFREITTIKKITEVLKKNRINTIIIYGIRTFPSIIISAKLAGIENILCIVNGSGRLFQMRGAKGFFTKSIAYPMLGLSMMLSNNILFHNIDDLKMIRRKGLLWKKNYDVINGSGVNLEIFKPNETEVRPIFLMISRITGSKGVNEYVEAARKVKKLFPEVEFHLVGPIDNNDLSLNMERFNTAIEKKIITFMGEVEDVKPYISNCRIFVLPSYHEGTPRTILEAMAMGKAILTTDAVGCRETVIDGINGFKVPVKDVKMLSEKMIWMIQNKIEVEKMGEESRILCEEKYDVHKINKKIINKINS